MSGPETVPPAGPAHRHSLAGLPATILNEFSMPTAAHPLHHGRGQISHVRSAPRYGLHEVPDLVIVRAAVPSRAVRAARMSSTAAAAWPGADASGSRRESARRSVTAVPQVGHLELGLPLFGSAFPRACSGCPGLACARRWTRARRPEPLRSRYSRRRDMPEACGAGPAAPTCSGAPVRPLRGRLRPVRGCPAVPQTCLTWSRASKAATAWPRSST